MQTAKKKSDGDLYYINFFKVNFNFSDMIHL